MANIFGFIEPLYDYDPYQACLSVPGPSCCVLFKSEVIPHICLFFGHRHHFQLKNVTPKTRKSRHN